MKKIFVALILLLAIVGCDPDAKLKHDTELLNEHLTCAWNDKYSVCFCYAWISSDGSLFTYVPDKVCGK